ncbi:MAG: tRNA (N(6)-L-threonylcarbamoyladenosine(37)-C(2))-methylthiotransferase MtaB [Oscillospiraceae bacterium]|jgi:threonylcarbamoyladenosine tRNA methylthiotransferase MtaB|nr:tRNA (N(6)-L-threonylcarbamoyladenosine(37)-C(2))-methylthiotransferase MtaB [Oscillospiraceae bacterium]
MHFLLTTLGCKVNQYESSGLSAELERFGFKPAFGIESAAIFILNSCTVTENSDKKTRQLLNSARSKNPRVITVLTGCFPQAFPEKARELGADIICGTSKRSELLALILSFMETRAAIDKITDLPDTYEEFSVFSTDKDFSPNSGRTRAFIKIQDGCDCNCAYCIVPKARGNPRSRPPDSIRAEAEAAAGAGYKELVLTGINLTKYEFGLYEAVSIAAQFAERVRLSSVEPDLLTDALLEKLAQIKKLCPHFHLSLQSGSDSILKRMGRRYTADEYYKKVQKIRSLFKTPAFTTDMMTGFPGETEEEFVESLGFARKAGFSKIHVFPFSARAGTAAASMENQVPENIRRERRNRLLSAADEMRREFLTAQIGRTLSVLVEKRTSADEVFGHAENYTPVKILSKTAQKNDILSVTVIKAENGFCVGK